MENAVHEGAVQGDDVLPELELLGRCTQQWQKNAERLAGVLGQCPALPHLHLRGNQLGAAGAEIH